jgi:predicted RNA binding protein YcfA (HicA-like mRNA interferase family)
MKRRDLIQHLEKYGCEFLREGRKHSVHVNRAAQKTSTVPRHKEINEFLARKICRDKFLSPDRTFNKSLDRSATSGPQG